MQNIGLTKSFFLLGKSLDKCYDCSYCRVTDRKNEFDTLPTDVSIKLKNVPVAINLLYGDPMLQVDKTLEYLDRLETAKHSGPIVIITKGPLKNFNPKFNLDIHLALSTFGIDSPLDGSSMDRFRRNLETAGALRESNNIKMSIEFRPIIYTVNDQPETIFAVLDLAKQYNCAVAYSGLQGTEELKRQWLHFNTKAGASGLPFTPFPGTTFGHKKHVSEEVEHMINQYAKANDVPVFRKTSCLISYVHMLERDYNAHYYRPTEVGCANCVMSNKCHVFYNNLCGKVNLTLPYKHEIIYKENHVCRLKQKGICEFPTEDCSKIRGWLIQTKEDLTTSDVRLTKWLTGMTVDADFKESPRISKFWKNF
jgi:hypothetical protein